MARTLPLCDYALIGNLQTAALVGNDGTIDWLCWPRFDSGACFAGLLGTAENGHWSIAPVEPVSAVERRYRPDTLILETVSDVPRGRVRVTDFMPMNAPRNDLVRIVEGLSGQVRMRCKLRIRFDYGSVIPWVQKTAQGLSAIAGPDALILRTPVETHGENFHTVAEFDVRAGERVPFTMSYFPSFGPVPAALDPLQACAKTQEWWEKWCAQSTYDGGWNEAVRRSLITLKALSHAQTGGIVAAPTTSLPERIGGVRNWDYRFCWLRDATFTLYALLLAGYREEAQAWRRWLLHAAAGRPQDLQILYGLGGERRLTELELPWLAGYRDSRPVRIGNAAGEQFQLDVFGEVLDALHLARRSDLGTVDESWSFQCALLKFLEDHWQDPDTGIWEVRGPRQHFTYSKVMVWVAFDRAIKAVERFKLAGPVDDWRRMRARIHAEVCEHGVDPRLGGFVQSFGSDKLDASVLLLPLVGFLPASDPRMLRTVELIEQRLMFDGFVLRYRSDETDDGLPEGEGAFLPCSFWLADNYALTGRHAEACKLFERLLSLRNDVGLLSEEYDPHARSLLGNFPQALTHVALVNTARNLSRSGGPAERRSDDTVAPARD